LKWITYPWNSRNSIRIKLALGVLLIAAPLIAFLHYYNFYTVRVVHNQVSISNKNMLSLYMNQINAGLDNVDQYLLSLASSNYELQIMENPVTEDEYVLAQLRLSNKLNADLPMYRAMTNSIFVYSPMRKEITDATRLTSDNDYLLVKQFIQSGGMESMYRQHPEQKWFVHPIEGQYYLFRLYRTGELWIGAWVNVKTLKSPLSFIDLGAHGASLFLTDHHQPMTDQEYLQQHQIELQPEQTGAYMAGPNRQYLVVEEPSTKGNFSLAAIIPNETVLQNLPYLNRIVIIITAISILLLPVFFLFLRRTVLVPLNRILAAMKRIGDGKVHTRIEPIRTSDEFMTVHRTFNHMMEQMEQLKISVYEEQLSKQKAELQHLQLQINPHFFMNTLNLIYSLALDKDFELIKEMTLRLVKYFRYMFRSNLTFVPLKDELEHVRNYIGIHELRFQQKLVCDIQAPEDLRLAVVPPLMIQTFVENALKHAGSIEAPLVLAVHVELEVVDAMPYMGITIQDQGAGFREELLSLINAGERVVDEQGEHIGIWNTWHRLRLLYGERASLSFSNAVPHGAIVKLRLPLHPGKE
jgi:two-component system, sensor histidine kinase YesM